MMVVADGIVHNCNINNDAVRLVYIRSKQRKDNNRCLRLSHAPPGATPSIFLCQVVICWVTWVVEQTTWGHFDYLNSYDSSWKGLIIYFMSPVMCPETKHSNWTISIISSTTLDQRIGLLLSRPIITRTSRNLTMPMKCDPRTEIAIVA